MLPLDEVTAEVIVAAIGAAGVAIAAWLGGRRAGAPKVHAEASPGLVMTADRVVRAAGMIDHAVERVDSLSERVAVLEKGQEDIREMVGDTQREQHTIKHGQNNLSQKFQAVVRAFAGREEYERLFGRENRELDE